MEKNDFIFYNSKPIVIIFEPIYVYDLKYHSVNNLINYVFFFQEKDLPLNTPTLEQRIRRDRRALTYEYDEKSGYYLGETGTVI